MEAEPIIAEPIIDATIVIRRPAASSGMGDDLLAGRVAAGPREQIQRQLSADPADLEAVSAFAARQGLTVTESSAVKRTVHVQGTARRIQGAFGAPLSPEIADIVTAVLGLDARPVAKPH